MINWAVRSKAHEAASSLVCKHIIAIRPRHSSLVCIKHAPLAPHYRRVTILGISSSIHSALLIATHRHNFVHRLLMNSSPLANSSQTTQFATQCALVLQLFLSILTFSYSSIDQRTAPHWRPFVVSSAILSLTFTFRHTPHHLNYYLTKWSSSYYFSISSYLCPLSIGSIFLALALILF